MRLEKKYSRIKKLISTVKSLDSIHNEKLFLLQKIRFLEEEYDDLLLRKRELEDKLIPILEPDEINKSIYEIKNIVKSKLK